MYKRVKPKNPLYPTGWAQPNLPDFGLIAAEAHLIPAPYSTLKWMVESS